MSDLQIDEQSPERELLRTQPTPLKSPSPNCPRVKGFPPPAPLAFKIKEGFETLVTQSLENVVEIEQVLKIAGIAKVQERVFEMYICRHTRSWLVKMQGSLFFVI